MGTTNKTIRGATTQCPIFEVEWDDSAQGWRLVAFDEDGERTVLAGASVGYSLNPAVAAAVDAAPGSDPAADGLLWKPSDETDTNVLITVAAIAATAAMSALTSAEKKALKMLDALGFSSAGAATKAQLTVKGLLRDGNLTNAGKFRARAL